MPRSPVPRCRIRRMRRFHQRKQCPNIMSACLCFLSVPLYSRPAHNAQKRTRKPSCARTEGLDCTRCQMNYLFRHRQRISTSLIRQCVIMVQILKKSETRGAEVIREEVLRSPCWCGDGGEIYSIFRWKTAWLFRFLSTGKESWKRLFNPSRVHVFVISRKRCALLFPIRRSLRPAWPILPAAPLKEKWRYKWYGSDTFEQRS